MPEPTVAQQLVSLARAASRSAEALGRALVVIDEDEWQDLLRQTYPQRVELFEMCVRCLVAGDTAPTTIRDALRHEAATASPDRESCIDEVLTTELVLETELQQALQRDNWRDARMSELLALHLLRSQGFRRESLTLTETETPALSMLVAGAARKPGSHLAA